jgi:hypothetical protein
VSRKNGQRQAYYGPPKRFAMPIPKPIEYDFGCFPGQHVYVTKGLGRSTTLEGIVLNEYPQHIVIQYRTSFGMQTTSISKASLICGDARMSDIRGRAIRPSTSPDNQRQIVDLPEFTIQPVR